MKIALVSTLLLLLVAGVAWNAGEMHRRNCQAAGRVACSVLPWQAGHAKPKSYLDGLAEKYGLTQKDIDALTSQP
jgi:hypothetical protein